MTDTIEKNGNDISPLNGEFYSYLQAKGLLGEFPLRELATSELVRSYKFKVNSWPFFVSPEVVDEMKALNASMLPLICKSLRATFGGDPMKMASAMDMNPACCTLLFDGADLSNFCFRSDTILTDDGFKLLELNVGTDIGGWEMQWMEDTFRQHAVYREFFDRNALVCRNTPSIFFRFLIESAAKIERGSKLILIRMDKSYDLASFGDQLQHYIDLAIKESKADCRIEFFTSFDELYLSRDGVFHRGRRVHLLTFSELQEDHRPPLDLLRAIFGGKVACPDFPGPHLFSDKRHMALLHHAARNGLLSEEDAAQVKRYIPETFVLGGPLFSQAIRDEVLANKDAYVIKQCRGMQGIDVHVGRFTDDAQWREIIANLRQPETWIAQAYCESKKFYGHAGESRDVYNQVWGIFQFGQHYGGSWIRMMPAHKQKYDGVINSARGAEERVILEVPR